MTVFPKHTELDQFIGAGASKVFPADHTVVNISRL